MKDNEKARESAPFFKCETCDVICSKISDYDRHLLTRKHRRITEDNEKAPKNAKKSAPIFKCETCDVICSRKSEYERHMLTRKHLRITEDNEKARKSAESAPENTEKCQSTISCHCGKIYKYNSGLCKHKKICRFIENNKTTPNELSMDELTNAVVSTYTNTHIIVPPYNPHPEIQPSETTKIIMEILRDNKEFKNLLIEQHKVMLELVQNTQTITAYNATNSNNSTISNTNTNTNTNNNNNSNNKQFNIQFFLNEQCKNAINLSDFVENLQLNFDDLENVADRGYVEGITQIFMNGLKELDIYTRPVHCTDVKRETVHVRENNIWTKDTPDQCKIKAAIRRIAFRNVQQISKWNKEHPDYKILDSNDFKRSFQIMKQSLGNTIPGGVEKNNDKIAKNLLKSVYLDKQDPSLLCV
jgi:hypothetical protein